MSRVLTRDGTVKIGAYMFPDRKRPCLCVQREDKGNEVVVYGTFTSVEAAKLFMAELEALVGAVEMEA